MHTYNHETEKLSDAIGITEEELEQILDKYDGEDIEPIAKEVGKKTDYAEYKENIESYIPDFDELDEKSKSQVIEDLEKAGIDFEKAVVFSLWAEQLAQNPFFALLM